MPPPPRRDTTVDRTVGVASRPACRSLELLHWDGSRRLGGDGETSCVCVWQAGSALASRSQRSPVCFANTNLATAEDVDVRRCSFQIRGRVERFCVPVGWKGLIKVWYGVVCGRFCFLLGGRLVRMEV